MKLGKPLLALAAMLLSGCGNLDEVDYRSADGASTDCIAGTDVPVQEHFYARDDSDPTIGLSATQRPGDVWAWTAESDDELVCAEDNYEELPPRAHRYLWITARHSVAIDAIAIQRGGGESKFIWTTLTCPREPSSESTCDRLFGPPGGCGEYDSHMIPAGSPLIVSLCTVIEPGDLITLFTCDDPAPADNLVLQVAVEPYAVVDNPLVSCPLEDVDGLATCVVPELPPVVELDPSSYDEALIEYFDAEPEDPDWADEAEQTIHENIATGFTTNGESIFDTGLLDEWCVDNWGDWDLDVDCRTTMCRVFAFGAAAVEECLVRVLFELVPHGFGARGEFGSDYALQYFSREGYDLPNF